jgi:hypothetical protein
VDKKNTTPTPDTPVRPSGTAAITAFTWGTHKLSLLHDLLRSHAYCCIKVLPPVGNTSLLNLSFYTLYQSAYLCILRAILKLHQATSSLSNKTFMWSSSLKSSLVVQVHRETAGTASLNDMRFETNYMIDGHSGGREWRERAHHENGKRMSDPPSPPPPPSHPASSPAATPAPASNLNPQAPPFFSAGASSSHLSGELPHWLLYSPSSSSSSESDEQPPPADAGKGKAPQVAAKAPPKKRRRRRGRPDSGFMADARRAPAPASRFAPADWSRRVPPATPDADGWQVVECKKKRHCAGSHVPVLPSKRSGKVPVDLIGLCFNCFSSEHVARDCPNPSCCLRCREPGHQASECSRPRLLLGDHRPEKRGRDRLPPCLPRRTEERRVHRRPLGSLIERSRGRPTSRSPRDLTPPALSCSTDDEREMPSAVKKPPTDSAPSSPPLEPPSPEPTPLPLGAPERRPLVDICVVHRSEEIDAAERALEFALVAVIGGSRPTVSIFEVRSSWLQEFFGIPNHFC